MKVVETYQSSQASRARLTGSVEAPYDRHLKGNRTDVVRQAKQDVFSAARLGVGRDRPVTGPGRTSTVRRRGSSEDAIVSADDCRCAPTVNRRAAAARRILPTLSDAFQDAAKRPVAVPCGGGAAFATSGRIVPAAQPMPAVARIILAAAGAVSTAREGTFCRVANGVPAARLWRGGVRSGRQEPMSRGGPARHW